MSSELPELSSYHEGAVRNPINKSGQFDRPAFPHLEPRAPSGGAGEAAGPGRDELQSGCAAVDDVLEQAEATEVD